MPDISLRLGREVLVIDGAMGTMLQRQRIPAEQAVMQLNVTAPEMIAEVHHLYALAGADCATTNSFGGTRHKLDAYGLGDQVVELNRAAVRVARMGGAVHILADVGPTGLVLEPLGSAVFDEVFGLFAEQVAALAAEHPDAILIETMTDIAEARCAVLAARSVTDLPVFATCTFGLNGRMDLSGTDPETAAVILEAVGASAVGLNCGLGPEQILPLVNRMASATSLPVIVQPNAGLPRLEDGVTVFPGTADEMGEYAARFVSAGASLVGSCCGSNPEFTGSIVDFAKDLPLAGRGPAPAGVAIAGPRKVVRIGAGLPLVRVGERINPTGKKRLAESLRAGTLDIVREYAIEQVDAGADLLDVNVGAAGVVQSDMLPKAVLALAGLVDLPLVIDTTDAVALEEALKIYPGRALVNSVSGEGASLAAVLPLAVRYGAAVVALALDDAGIPHSASARVDVVRRVRDAARAAGLADADLVADCLVLAAATEEGGATATLEAIHRVTAELGLATIAGVSNVSHGLPGRPVLNATFLSMAVAQGLTAAIVNPLERGDAADADAVAATRVLLGRDERAAGWIAIAGESSAVPDAAPNVATSDEERLALAIERGDSDSAPGLVDDLVAAGLEPQRVISEVLTPAIQRLGDAYGRGEVFLPQLIAAAEAMRAAVERAKSRLSEGADMHEGRVAFGTVKGDIHSIGKDICVSMLESQGYLVHDLGVDVSPEAFALAASDADAICLSALMTTTLAGMERAIAAVRAVSDVPVLVGGAVVTRDFAYGLGAGYSEDAPGCVTAVREAISRHRGQGR